jgi:hypothetical protein
MTARSSAEKSVAVRLPVATAIRAGPLTQRLRRFDQ